MLAQPIAQPEEATTWIRAEFGNLYHDVTKNFSDQANAFALLQDSVANAHEQSEKLTDGTAAAALLARTARMALITPCIVQRTTRRRHASSRWRRRSFAKVRESSGSETSMRALSIRPRHSSTRSSS